MIGKRSLFIISTAILTSLGMLGLFMAALDSQSAAAYDGEPPAFGLYEKAEYVPGRILVKFRDNLPVNLQGGILRTGDAQVDNLLSGEGVVDIRPLIPAGATRLVSQEAGLSRIYRLDLGDEGDVFEAISQFQNNPEVEWAEPDYIARSAAETASPDDPLLPGQWGLAKIEAQQAWDVVTGTQSVVIAVLDSGIDKTHVDLSSQLWVNPGEIPGNSLDDDNNGFVDDINGWDFVNEDNDPSDDNGHGTQAAGIAAAITNNTAGIAGMCWNCRIMPVKVMQVSGIANYSDITAGIWYAAQKGAKVINLSLGGYGYSVALQTAIQAAINTYGAVVVAGAGNDNLDLAFYPAAYPEVLAVAGTTDLDEKATLSNYGSWVDVSAPAINITTTFLGGDWGPVNGTSFAAPFASGLAGLLRSQHTDWTPEMVKSHIERTADDIDSLNPAYAGKLGAGRIDAASAVQIEPHPILSLVTTTVNGDPLGRPVQGEDAALEVTLLNDWSLASGVTGTLSTTDGLVTIGAGDSSFGNILPGETGTSNPPYTFTVDMAAGYNHPIPFVLQFWSDGGIYSTTELITITTRSADEPVGGTIALDTTWTNDKTYQVNSDVGIAPGFTLTIQPGTEIVFMGNYSFNVGGTLIADGTQSQPIRFHGQSGGSWGRIYFDDPGIDATTDISGTYQAGNILRWVQVDDAAQGIGCNSATPYLSHVELSTGGVNCTLGATTLWLQDNNLVGNVTITGAGQAWRNTITNGGLNLSGQSTVQENQVSGGISTGTDSFVIDNSAGGAIAAPGASTVANNTSSGITSGNSSFVQLNQITGGSISSGSSSTVLTNTVTGGGISIGTGSTVSRNNIEDAPGWGISSSGSVVLTYNRIVDGVNGVSLSGGNMQANLVANNSGIGLQVNGNSTVISNTFTGNSGSTIKLVSATSLTINGNNLEGNHGTYDIENLIPKTTLMMVQAMYNWWGTTGSAAIAGRIFDFNDDYNKGQVLFAPVALGAIQSAPAYVRSIIQDPPSPVGIEKLTLDITFSRPMQEDILPEVAFRSINHSEMTVYNTSNSGIPDNSLFSIAGEPTGSTWFGTMSGGAAHFDGTNWTVYNGAGYTILAIANAADGSTWFGTQSGAVHFDGTNWNVYNTSNSGLPHNIVWDIAIAGDGSIWFGTSGGGAAHFDGTNWMVYNTLNSELPANDVRAIEIATDGLIWFGTTYGGVANFNGTKWTVYDSSNSELPADDVRTMAIAADDSVWFGTMGGGAAHFDGTNWMIYDTGNSGLPHNSISAIASSADGSTWFGTHYYGAAHFDGTTWSIYNISNSSLPSDDIYIIASATDGSTWFGSYGGGAAKLWNFPYYLVNENAHWLDSTHFRASYEINTLVPRDTYSITVKNATGLDGIQITPNNANSFEVDYAGAIGDTTPPPIPAVEACASSNQDTLSASWSADDPDSTITLYRYAIGTTVGGSDIVNWTNTTGTSFLRSGLGLLPGELVYISVKARNDGGLWSPAGTPPGVIPGSDHCESNIPSSFAKISPANGTTGLITSPTLSWGASSGSTSYEYCIDTSDNGACDTSWVSTASNTSANLNGLPNDTTHYWQVRANNPGGTTYANGDEWWSFTTIIAAPAAFSKSTPATSATGISTSTTLNWGPSSGVTSYEYCIDTSNNNTCDTSWVNTGNNASANLNGLPNDTTHYWQVRAINAGGTTNADGSTWWSFTTVVAAPAAFNKISPTNGVTGISISPTLSWGSSIDASNYEYCIDTTNDNACNGSWINVGSNTDIQLGELDPDTIYYWQVRAKNVGGTTYSNGETIWWHFQTEIVEEDLYIYLPFVTK